MIELNQNHLLSLDDYAVAVFLKLPASQVAFLQSLLETYEGVGTVRTLDVKNSLIAIITTTTQLALCEQILKEIKATISWSYESELSESEKLGYFGFMKTEGSESTF